MAAPHSETGRPVRIVVDGTTNTDPATRRRLGIAIIPIHISGLPGEVASRLAAGGHEALYDHLDRPHRPEEQCGTRAGSVWEARQVFEDLIRWEDCDIICLVACGRLSAVYDNASRAARELSGRYENRIVVLGEQAFLALELLGEAAAAYAAAGHGFEEVLAFIEDKQDRAFMTGSIVDLARLRRSGRVAIPRTLTLVARPFLRLFGLVPTFILEEGRPRTTALIRKRRLACHALDTTSERVGFHEPVIARVAYSGSGVRAEAEKLRDAVVESPELRLAEPVAIERVSPVVGVHAGSSLVAFAALGLGYDLLSTPVLVRILQAAQAELQNFRRMLNAINVFPVRDGDTGSNLLSPLTGVDTEIAEDLPFPEALDRVASLVARRGGGYSGGALAAYLLGVAAHVRAHESGPELGLETLVGALARGTDRAYEYFGEDAKEGTILSVMRACDRAAAEAFRTRPTLRHVLGHAWLAATDELLSPAVQPVEILRREHLAHAGGVGFALLFWAALDTLGLSRDSRLRERRRLVLYEVRRHAELGGRLVYRRQPAGLRGYCVEASVRGDVARELRAEFGTLDNRLAEPKLTFNFADGVTHFHFHVSPGLEAEVLRIAARHGFAEQPRPPTRLDKRRREIVGFRLLGILKRIAGHIVSFSVNWVAYALLFPIMRYRAYRRLKALETKIEHLALSRLGLAALADTTPRACLLLDAQGNVTFANASAGRPVATDAGVIEDYLPREEARVLRFRLSEADGRQAAFSFNVGDRVMTVQPLGDNHRAGGFLVLIDRAGTASVRARVDD